MCPNAWQRKHRGKSRFGLEGSNLTTVFNNLSISYMILLLSFSSSSIVKRDNGCLESNLTMLLILRLLKLAVLCSDLHGYSTNYILGSSERLSDTILTQSDSLSRPRSSSI